MGRDLPVKEDTPGEPDRLCADTTTLRELGWFPTINIMNTLKDHESPKLATQFGEATETKTQTSSLTSSTAKATDY